MHPVPTTRSNQASERVPPWTRLRMPQRIEDKKISVTTEWFSMNSRGANAPRKGCAGINPGRVGPWGSDPPHHHRTTLPGLGNRFADTGGQTPPGYSWRTTPWFMFAGVDAHGAALRLPRVLMCRSYEHQISPMKPRGLRGNVTLRKVPSF